MMRAAYTRRIVAIEEESRRRCARNLHDILGPDLTALGIDLNLALLQAPADLAEPVIGHLHSCVDRVKAIALNMRNLMTELRPPVLDEYGLAAALRWHAEQVSNLTCIPVTVSAEELVPRLSFDVETALFRIAQEALAVYLGDIRGHLSSQKGGKSPLERLSGREREILQLVVEGKTSAFLANSLASGGFLMLGEAETVPESLTPAFSEILPDLKIYRKHTSRAAP